MQSFKIHNISFNFSDHKPISVSIQIPILAGVKSSQVAEYLLSNSFEKTLRRERKVYSDRVDWNAYGTLVDLKLRNIANEITGNELTEEFFEQTVNEIDTVLYKTALLFQRDDTQRDDDSNSFGVKVDRLMKY